MVENLLHLLWIQTLVLSVAVAAVVSLRRPLARRFGAESAYLAWTLPPLALLAAALPHRAHEAQILPAAIARLVPAFAPPTVDAPHAASLAFGTPLFVAWAVVAAALVVAITWRQRRFHAGLSSTHALPTGSGPAVIGIVRPRVVLPVDFEDRFDAIERALMLAHEAVHQRRRDNAWNLLACALVVVHWFNPLAWLAWRWMRVDQELSCDAAVLRDAGPHPVRVYAAALLKVQGVALHPPLATSWQSTHPLVERVRMLNLHALSSANRRSGRRLVALAIVLGGAVAYASQPPADVDPGSYSTFIDEGPLHTKVTLAIDGRPPHEVRMTDGHHIRFQAQPEVGLPDWLGALVTVKPLGDNKVMISTILSDETTAAVLAKPSVVTRMDEPARIDVSSPDGAHKFSITYVALASKDKGTRESTDAVAPKAKPALPAVPPTSALAPLPPVPSTTNLPPVPPVPSTDALRPLPPVPALKAPPAPSSLPAPPAPADAPRVQRAV